MVLPDQIGNAGFIKHMLRLFLDTGDKQCDFLLFTESYDVRKGMYDISSPDLTGLSHTWQYTYTHSFILELM